MRGTTYKTRLGEFVVRADCVHGCSIYRSSRTMTIYGKRVNDGDLFAVGHRDPRIFENDPVPCLYSGSFVARFSLDGTEVPSDIKVAGHLVVRVSPPPLPPQECCENDTMSW